MNRRSFLATSLAAGVATTFGADAPPANFPTEPRARLAVSTYPFRHTIARGSSGMTLEQFAQTVRPKLNVPGIEPWSRHFQSTDDSYLRGLRKAFDSAGLHVVDMPVDANVTLCQDAARRTQGLAIWRKWVDTAVLLGSPSIRVHLPHGETDIGADCAVTALTELTHYASGKNIVVNLENDDPQSERPERIAKVIRAVNSPFLRALPDFCNSMLVENDQAFNEQALRTLFSLAFNISHVKDIEVDGNKVYRVDVDRIFATAKQAGYRGYFSMEWEGEYKKPGDDYAGTLALISASLRNLG